MRKLAALLTTALAFSGSAFAADMAVKAPPPPPPAPVYSWTGFYVGANGGYGWKDPTVTFGPNDLLSLLLTCAGVLGTCPPSTDYNIDGPLGGLQAGYNWQFNQKWLLGVETDFDWSRIKGTGTSNFNLSTFPANFVANEDIHWFGTVRARFGFLPTSQLLLFGTGGLAYGRVGDRVALNTTVTNTAVGAPFSFDCAVTGGTNCFLGSSSYTAVGWTAGGGLEYALGNHVSVKAEYLYVNLGGGRMIDVVAQAPFPPPIGAGTTPSSFTAIYSTTGFNVVRGGVNWKF